MRHLRFYLQFYLQRVRPQVQMLWGKSNVQMLLAGDLPVLHMIDVLQRYGD